MATKQASKTTSKDDSIKLVGISADKYILVQFLPNTLEVTFHPGADEQYKGWHPRMVTAAMHAIGKAWRTRGRARKNAG